MHHPSESRRTLLFAVIAATSVSAAALALTSYLKPIGEGDGAPGYAAIAPVRGYVYGFFLVAGVQLIVGVCALAVAGWILTPARGARWGTAGGALIWLGAAVYGVGIGGWAATYYYASDASVLGPATAARLVQHVNDDTARFLAVPIAGALVVTLGGLVLSVGLWRARTIPRWLVLGTVLTSLATLVVPPDTVFGVVAETASSATSIAIGWYVWRPAQAVGSARPIEASAPDSANRSATYA